MSYVVSKGVRSLDVPGVGRVRVDADKAANVPAFMKRLAVLEELERCAGILRAQYDISEPFSMHAEAKAVLDELDEARAAS